MADMANEETWEVVDQAAARIETDHGLDPGSLRRLRSADDWTLALQIGALIEVACRDALSRRLDVAELDEPLRNMPMDGRTSIVGFLDALGLLASEQRQLLRGFIALRNHFAHDIRRITTRISQYLRSDRGADLYLRVTDSYDAQARAELSDGDLRQLLWLTALRFLQHLEVEVLRVELARLKKV